MKKTGNAASNPTWYGNIKDMFTEGDIGCMQGQFGTAFNLGSYQFVSTHSDQILQVVASGYMPKGGPAWTTDQVGTFRNWMANGCPEGTAPAVAHDALLAATPPATRLRKDIRSIDPNSDELKKLKTAFQGIMDLPPSNPNSYFALAGIHWLPAPDFWCMHHDPGFLSWHRAYQIVFENALRTIPGCEDVTLPYWDITMTDLLPSWLYEPPFASYTFPEEVASPPKISFPKGHVTQRYEPAVILSKLKGNGKDPSTNVFSDVANAMAQVSWEKFNGFFADADFDTLIAAHDNGHDSTGDTMMKQEIAAFDPIFWFFHNNWDRLFWEWQKANNATTLAGMQSRIANDQASYNLFTDPIFGHLAPFTAMDSRFNAQALLNFNDWGIDYAPPVTAAKPMALVQGVSSLHAARTFTLTSNIVHIRVDGLNRLKIAGSFKVHLLKDGKVLASRAFFQPIEVDKCATCVKNAIVHFDFKLPDQVVSGGKLSLWVEPSDKKLGESIPLAALGNPTITAKIPLNS